MDEKVKKKGSKIDGSNSRSSFELEPKEGKKKKHKETKKKHGTDEILNLSQALEENCTGEAAERQTCSMEDESHINKRKKKKGRKDIEVINGNIADDKEMQFLDDNQQMKMKKRKDYDDSLAGMQEMGASKPSKKGRMTSDKDEFKSNKGDPPLDNVITGDAYAHSPINEVDCQGKKMKKKKKPSSESKSTEKSYQSSEGDHSFVIGKEQGKKMKMEKILSKKNKRTEDEDYKTSEGDPCLAKSNVVDPPSVKSNEGDQHLVKNNEGEDDDQGKKMIKKKKLSEKSKLKKNNEFKINEGDQHLAKSNGEDDDQSKKMKKKTSGKRKSKDNNDFKSNEGDANEHCIVTVDDQGKKMKVKKKIKASTNESPNPTPGGRSKPKRVTFSDRVEVCSDGLVRGKRFTPEEDEKIKEAVEVYIKSHGLGDEGKDMILHCMNYPEVRDCWNEITAALPHRPRQSVYSRAHILFERDKERKWTTAELDKIREIQEQHGSNWKLAAEVLGKSRFHVKDAWRRIKLTNTNTGHWSQEEYQNLFNLVNMDLSERALEGYRQSKHGMLRDNISWEAIASKLSTRASAICCKKWYEQITSPMVADGIWSDTDDYRLVNALYALDACCFEEVDWDDLLEHRSGDVCRKRWNQMVRYIGEHVGKSFAEQVEILANRFCPNLVEAREAFDSKPVL